MRAGFGLGDAAVADEVSIVWPHGFTSVLTAAAVDRMISIVESTWIQPNSPVAALNGGIVLSSRVPLALQWQWYFEGVRMSGQTNKQLALTNLTSAAEGRYSLVSTTSSGLATNMVYLRVIRQFSLITEGNPLAQTLNTGGVVPLDGDEDGLLDLYVQNSSLTNKTKWLSGFLHNEGEGRFVEVTGSGATGGSGGLGPTVADYDNDGHVDLYVPRFGAAQPDLFRGDGKGGFSVVTNQPFSTGKNEDLEAQWTDFNRDGLLDLFISGGPNNPQKLKIFRNTGDGGFQPLNAAQAGNVLGSSGGFATATVLDYDMDGAPDIVASRDWSIVAYHNDGKGILNLTTVPGLTGFGADLGYMAWADYDNDGFPDVFVGPALSNTGATLYRNVQGKKFSPVSKAWGTKTLGTWGSGIWGDYDNDGFLDLLVVMFSGASELLRNRGDGTFEATGFVLPDPAYNGGMWVDYDNNGTLDLVLGGGAAYDVQVDGLSRVYRNAGNGNHWLKCRLRGTISNRDGVGAKVWVTATIGRRTFTQMREISSSILSGCTPLLAHFGLGDSTNAIQVRIDWPSGVVQELTNVQADQSLTIVEPRPWMISARLVGGSVQLNCVGAAGSRMTLEESTDLRAWVGLKDLTMDSAGAATVLIPVDGTGSLLFFRIRQAP